MNEKQETIAAILAKGASVHRIAERIIASKRAEGGPLWRTHAAALLAVLLKMKLGDAKAIISEMSLD